MPKSLTAAVVLLASAAVGHADDLIPPPWDRFTPGTTFHTWTFTANTGPIWAPDPGGYGDDTRFMDFLMHSDWLPDYQGRSGVFAAPAGGGPYLVSAPIGRPYLDVYFQLVSHEDGMARDPMFTGKGGPPVQQIVELLDAVRLPEGDGRWWYKRYRMQGWDLPPVNSFIAFFQNSPLLLDQMVIDWTPEPSSAAALVAMAMLAVRPKRTS